MKKRNLSYVFRIISLSLILIYNFHVKAQTPDLACPTNLIIPDGYNVDDLLKNPAFYPYVGLSYDPITQSTLVTLSSQNQIVRSQGEFTIEQPFQILKTHMVFESGASIKVIPSAKPNVDDGKLVIKESLLEACILFMWEGINLTTGSNQIYMLDSEIRDAENAILSNNGAHFEVINSTFDANYIGINITEFQGQHSGSVSGTTFKASQFLLSPRLGSRAYAGIQVTDVLDLTNNKGLKIGNNNSAASKNYFYGPDYAVPLISGMKFGIRSISSGIEIINNVFTGFVSIDVTDPNDKIPVYATGTSTNIPNSLPEVIVGKNGLNERNFFYQSNRNIELIGVQISKIENNFFDNFYVFTNADPSVAIGIRDNMSNYGSVLIKNNDINNLQQGISSTNMTVSEMLIQENQINLSSPSRTYGIVADNNHPIGAFKIEQNNISSACQGIKVANSSGPEILNNYIGLNANTYGSNSLNIGVDILNTFNTTGNMPLKIWNNDIVGENIVVPPSNKQTGIEISMSGHDAIVSCNNISHTTTSIHYLGINSHGDDSFIFGNAMSNADFGFAISNGSELANIGLESFPSDNTWDMISFHTTTSDLNTNGQFTRFWTRGGGLPYVPSTNLFFGNFNLPITIDPTANGNLYDCNNGFTPPFQRSSSKVTIPNTKNNSVFSSVDWLKEYSFIKTFKSKKSTLSSSTINYLDSLESLSIGKTVSAQNNTDSLNKYKTIRSNFIEENLLFAYAMRQTIMDSSLQSLDKVDYFRLDTIAKSCPFVVGPSVYEARGILFELYGSEYYNLCEGVVGKNGSKPKFRIEPLNKEINIDFSIYPNPTSEILSIESRGSNGTYRMVDVYGKIVFQGVLKVGRNQINVSEFNTGVYFLLLNDLNNKIVTKKVIIE